MPSPTQSGSWRPNTPFDGQDGLKITMTAEPGMTPSGLLTVPFRFHTGPMDPFTRASTYNWQTNSTIAAGEQATDAGDQLDRIQFQTMLLDLDEGHPWVVWRGTFDVQRMLAELRSLMKAPAPFRLTIGQPALWGPTPLTNIIAVLTSLSAEEHGGEIGTEYTNVEFMEVKHQVVEESSTRKPSATVVPRRETVKPGDTLYAIALRLYKKKSAWKNITSANGITGVTPDDAGALAAWLKSHNRSTLKIPVLPASPKKK